MSNRPTSRNRRPVSLPPIDYAALAAAMAALANGNDHSAADDAATDDATIDGTLGGPPIETAAPLPPVNPRDRQSAGSFSLRRGKGGASGEVVWHGRKGKSGIAACPALDESSRKVMVEEKDKAGNTRKVPKTLHLDDFTRNTVGPIMADTYRTVADDGNTTGKQSIRIAMLDADGKPVPQSIATLVLSTSAGGSLMLSGELSLPVPVADSTGKGVVVFVPPARQTVYFMGQSFIRQDGK